MNLISTKIKLFIITFIIFLVSGNQLSLVPTGDEIHRIIQSHSLVYDYDFDMKNDYKSSKFSKWACCDKHIHRQEHAANFEIFYDLNDDLDNGEWINSSNFKNFPRQSIIRVINSDTIKIFNSEVSDSDNLYMTFEPDMAGNNIIRNQGYPGYKIAAINMKDGQLGVIFAHPLYTSINVVDFKKDKSSFWGNRHLPGGTSSYAYYNGNISQRNQKLNHTTYENDKETINYDDGLSLLEEDYKSTKKTKLAVIEKIEKLEKNSINLLSHSFGPSFLLIPVGSISKILNLSADNYIKAVKIYMNILWSLSILLIFSVCLKLKIRKNVAFFSCILVSFLYPSAVYASSANADSFGFILISFLIYGSFYIKENKNLLGYSLYIISVCLLPWFHFRYILISILGILFVLLIEYQKNDQLNLIKIIKKYKFSIFFIILSLFFWNFFEYWRTQDGRIPATGLGDLTLDPINFVQQIIRALVDPFEGILIPFSLSLFGFAGIFLLIKKFPVFAILSLLIFSIDFLAFGLAPESNYYGLYYGMRYHIGYISILFIGIAYFINELLVPTYKNITQKKIGISDVYLVILFFIFLIINLIPTFWLFSNDQLLSSGRLFGPNTKDNMPAIMGYDRISVNILHYLQVLVYFLIFISLISKDLLNNIYQNLIKK